MITIQKALPKDFPKLAKLQAAWLKEQNTVYALDIVKSIAWFQRFLEKEYCACFVAWKDEEPIGWIMGEISEFTFSSERAVNELAWFVEKKHRGGVGKALLKQLSDWGKEHGAKLFLVTLLNSASSDNSLRAEQAVRKLGFKSFYQTYYAELHP